MGLRLTVFLTISTTLQWQYDSQDLVVPIIKNQWIIKKPMNYKISGQTFLHSVMAQDSCLMFWFSMPSCVSCPFSVSVAFHVAVCFSLSVIVFPSVHPHLVTSPDLLPPLSLHLFLVSSLVSVYLVSAFLLVFVRSLLLLLLLLLSVSCPSRVPSVSRLETVFFDLYLICAFFFALCWAVLFCYFVFLFCCIQLCLILSSPPFVSPQSCLLSCE